MKHQSLLISGGLFSKIITTAILFTLFTGFETIFAGTAPERTDGINLPGYYPVPEEYSGDNSVAHGTAVSVANMKTEDPKCTDVPTVVTKPATDITATCATLKGTVNPNLGSTNYWFEWGTTTSYGNTTTPKYAGGGSTTQNVFSYISGLVAGTTYHFRLVATNPLGTGYANDMSFVAGSVTLTTTPVTGITDNSAISGGIITANGGFPVTARGICWGTSPDPEITGDHTLDGSGSGTFTSTLSGLTPGTLYHVRAYATNVHGTFYGNGLTFTTLFCGNFSLPFLEEFVSGNLPDCWSLIDHQGNGEGWQFGTISNQTPNPALNGNYAYLNSNDYDAASTQNADLVSPVFDFSGYDTVSVLFNHYILCNNGSSGKLSYSLDLGLTWNLIQTFSTTSLTNPVTFSQSIPAVAQQPQAMFKWNYTGIYGDFWAIDDVQISGVLPTPSLTVSPSNQNVLPPSGSVAFAVTSNSNWTAVSDQPWCSVTPSGAGNGTLTATYTVNNSASQRIANITVTVSGHSPVVVTVTQAALILSVSPENHDVSYLGGSVVFDVTSNTMWSASPNQSWCSLVLSNTGNGTITAVYAENSIPSPRIAEITITVDGLPILIVTITQAAAPLSLIVTPTNRDVLPSAGSTTFTVTTPLSWSASSDQLWCTVTPGGVGSGTITASCEENTSDLTRVANITVSAEGVSAVVVTVTQAYLESEFLLSARNLIQTSPNTLEFDVFLLDTDASQPFELASIQFGFLLNSEIYTGGVLTATYDNTTSGLNLLQQFTATPSLVLTLNGYPGLTLMRQAGKSPPGYGNGTIISTTGDGTLITHYIITSSVPFTANTYPNLTFTSNTVTIPLYNTRVAAYINSTNTQLPVIPGVNAIIPENPLLNGPPELEVVPGSQTVDTTAGNVGFVINANTTWVANTDQSWVTITPSGFGNGTLMANYDPNNSEPRSAVITISAPGLEDQQVTLSQEGVELKTLNLHLLIQGLYAGNGTMNQAHDANGPHFEAGISDLISVELHNSSDYDMIEHIATGVEVSTSGNATISLPPTLNGSYYITIKHRNSIETTSASPVLFDAQNISYDYNSPAKAFGNNLQLMIDGHYVIKSGDINQDGIIDTADLTLIDNSAYNYDNGYITPDINGDGLADTADMTIVDNNSADYVSAITP